MSANPHSVVHARQFTDVEKSKDEQPRKSEPGVKGVVSWLETNKSMTVFLWVIAAQIVLVHSVVLPIPLYFIGVLMGCVFEFMRVL